MINAGQPHHSQKEDLSVSIEEFLRKMEAKRRILLESETVEMSVTHNEKRGLGKLDTHRPSCRKDGFRGKNFCKCMVEHGVEWIVKRQILLRASTDRKFLGAIIAYVLKVYGTVIRKNVSQT